MKLITIENKLYKITEKDWKTFERKVLDRYKNEEEWDEILKFIVNNYQPIAYIEGSYNF